VSSFHHVIFRTEFLSLEDEYEQMEAFYRLDAIKD